MPFVGYTNARDTEDFCDAEFIIVNVSTGVFQRFTQDCVTALCFNLSSGVIFRVEAAPMAEWVRSINFSALNHSIISPLCLV